MGKYALEEIFEVIEKEYGGVDLEMDIEELEEVVGFIEDGLTKKTQRRQYGVGDYDCCFGVGF